MNRALLLSGSKDSPVSSLETMPVASLPEQGDTLVRIAYSSLNYKDGLALTGKGKIIRSEFPFVPGIDLVGEVVRTGSNDLFPGDWVIGTGWGIGENYWGGYSQFQWTDPSWLVPLPDGMTPQQAMTAGTAGLTAMIAVDALERQGLDPESGSVLVTGASGGVGSFAVAILSILGFDVVASTGKDSAHDYLKSLGAAEIIGREALGGGARYPMESARWAGAIDSVGSRTLEAIIAQLSRHASVAVCGLAGGSELRTTVFPFILRGVNLLGIDSNTCPTEHRTELWNRLATLMNRSDWVEIGRTISLNDLKVHAHEIVKGQVRGRIIVDVNAE
ncbi:MAG: oxidoreductase [Rhodothermales bacterium]|nr:oxidoreductase [Rhodothermales bacterium]